MLRDAERGVVPDPIADRPDKGIFTEPLVEGLARNEEERFVSSIALLATNPLRLTADPATLLERWRGRNAMERELAWRAATAGLWLQHGFNGAGPSRASDRGPIQNGEEVIHDGHLSAAAS